MRHGRELHGVRLRVGAREDETGYADSGEERRKRDQSLPSHGSVVSQLYAYAF